MKTNEIIQIAAMVVLAGALIYRKYGKKNKTGEKRERKLPGKSFLSSQSEDNDYEPYSKRNTAK
jgi:hypothetical protein